MFICDLVSVVKLPLGEATAQISSPGNSHLLQNTSYSWLLFSSARPLKNFRNPPLG